MKTTWAFLVLAICFIAGTAWVAQQWRLEATEYTTIKERDGDIIRQQLVSDGEKSKEEIKANFRRRGVIDAAKIIGETEGQGRIKVAEGDLERTRLISSQGLTTQEYIITPLQGTLGAEQRFYKDSMDQNLPQAEQRRGAVIYDLLKRSSANVQKEYQDMLDAIGKGMSLPRCPGDRPR
jgi:hypothetical protein